MSDPNLQPGYKFVRVRLLRTELKLKESPEVPQNKKGLMKVDFTDRGGAAGDLVRHVQQVSLAITLEGDAAPVLELIVELEGLFQKGKDSNIPEGEFLEKAAPSILFPFTREWVHRLTSQAGNLPAVLLPPMNLIALRENKLEAAKAQQAPRPRKAEKA